MDKALFDRVVAHLLPHMDDTKSRKSLIQAALYGCPVLQKMDWDGAASVFTPRLVQTLLDFGDVKLDKPSLIAVLEELQKQVGSDLQVEIQTLIETIVPPLHTQAITPPDKLFAADELYVFISYARPEQPIAEKIEAFLKAAGVRVFRDTSEIREGANWDMTIETALRDCQRMVLLLSKTSMPYRKEVHREWFYFDQKRKPIYPLYIEECDLHSRLYAYNYMDARRDLNAALGRLLKDLQRDFDLPAVSTDADKVGVFAHAPVENRTLPEAMQALLDTIHDPEGSLALSLDQATAIKDHPATNLTEYYLGRIAEWSLPRYQLDQRFVNLTLLLDKGEHEPQRWQSSDAVRFQDVRDILAQVTDAALVILGAPGSGKSTLLRRLQLDHSMERLRDHREQVSFFVSLNSYRPRPDGTMPDPATWLAEQWQTRYPHLPSLATFLQNGHGLLLLDALNEMPHRSSTEYHERVGLWRTFAQAAAQAGNRLIFSCRTLDYSALLSSPELRVPQIQVQPMDNAQIQAFLQAYIPSHADHIWQELAESAQLSLFQTPYFLKLLCEQVITSGQIPRGRASLFTGFVRQVLYREIHAPLLQPDSLLTDRDHQKLSLARWRNPFDLPEDGVLLPKMSSLAFTMQEKSLETEGAQVRIDYDAACDLLAHDRRRDILKVGVALNVLDEDIAQSEITFFHQLLQEFFAARQLAKQPNPALVQVAWSVNSVQPPLAEVLAALADGDPLPLLPQTGWEETTLTAVPMARDPNAFIRALLPHNLPLAARCAASPEVVIDAALKHDIQQALIARSQDYANADLRARIAAGLALGELGDPRFERRTGPHGDYLLPPMIPIPAGTYPIGTNDSDYDREKPAHTVELAAFEIGQFAVTNAEYALFMAAGGYDDDQWWTTDEAKAWRRGAGSTEGSKQQWRDTRGQLLQLSEADLQQMSAITPEQLEGLITIRNWTEARFENWLDEQFPAGKIYRQPEFWNDTRFNNPAQPVVGITWFEARAYCAWLSANASAAVGSRHASTLPDYHLPTEAQFEAAARGSTGRLFPYGETFDVTRSNTFESHIRRTTPIGIFDNATPEGAFDLSGNAYTWTTSIYNQDQFPYPYRADDGREDRDSTNVRRVLRGGSWFDDGDLARAVFRLIFHPYFRNYYFGFRVCRPVG